MSFQLPLFPLQLVVFPNEKLNLHIFEARYKQLIHECETNSTSFGVPPFIGKKMMGFGTELKLLSIEKVYPSGELDVKTLGVGLFEINEVHNPFPEKLYIGADVQRIDYVQNGNYLQSEKIIEYVETLYQMLAIPKDPPTDSATFSTYDVAHHIGLTLEQEFELLKLLNEQDRQDFVLQHLEKIIPKIKKINNIKERAMMNGHFRNIIPPNV
jgi:hypothetical protein